jgi:hypothetical protein
MVYPIKGCVGIAVKAAAVTSTGKATAGLSFPLLNSTELEPARVLALPGHLSYTCSPTVGAQEATYCAGLPFDRQWMVVQETTGKFVTQRQIPNLCKVRLSTDPTAHSSKRCVAGTVTLLKCAISPYLLVPPASCSPSCPHNSVHSTHVALLFNTNVVPLRHSCAVVAGDSQHCSRGVSWPTAGWRFHGAVSARNAAAAGASH